MIKRLLPLLMILAIMVACGSDPQDKAKAESAEIMNGLWMGVIVALSQNHTVDGVDDVITFLSESEMIREAYPDKDFSRSPVAEGAGPERPHYRLLRTNPETVSDSDQVVIESPALYDNQGTQVVDAGGNVHWIAGDEALGLWDSAQ